MDGRVDSGLEIRRILLLTRLKGSIKGMTMSQMTKDVGRVAGWEVSGTSISESVRVVLQSLIDEKLVVVKNRFVMTIKGREYLADPLKWRINLGTVEDVERRLFWNNIYAVFDKAFARLRTRATGSK